MWTNIATFCEKCFDRMGAEKLLLYPSLSATAKTFSRISSEIRPLPENTRETVDWDTPASRAISVSVGFFRIMDEVSNP